MLISNIYVDDDAKSFETPRKKLQCHCNKGPYLLGYDNDQSFETTKINNHSVTSPSAQILLGDDDDY